MNFLKKMMGFSGSDLKSQLQSTTINGTFYRVIKDSRNIIFPNARISFQTEMESYFIKFNTRESEEEKEYAFPIYVDMDLVTFSMTKQGKANSCFEWTLDEGDHVGCYMNPSDQQKFQDVVCKILKQLMNDQNIKDHMQLCKQLKGIPVYKGKQEEKVKVSSVSSSSVSKGNQESLNETLLKEAAKKQNKFVHSATHYEILGKQKNLVNDSMVFVLKNVDKFIYEFQLINATGFTYFRKQISSDLNYEVNTEISYLRWFHKDEHCKIVQVNFDGKRDAALSLKFAILQCQYEQNTKRRLQDAVAEDQMTYLRRMDEKVEVSDKIVKTYEDVKEQIEMNENKFVYGNKQAEKGLEKYRNLCQGKVHNFDIASLGSMFQVLKISENNEIQRVEKKKVQNMDKSREVVFENIHLHDNDEKALLNGEDGLIYCYDLEKGKVVQQYDICEKGIKDLCPQYKLAQVGQFKTFKAVSPNSIFEVDPRLKEGVTKSKSYQTKPEFNHISVDEKGNFAVSSANGQIRLYDKIGRNSNCKYPGFGDPVLHLDSTKDGKWLLATFKKYLLLLPTETAEQENLYQQKIKIDERPRPIKLVIKLQHLQMCKIKDLTMISAKFEERKDGKQRFIVSGFGEYVVIWNLARVIRGDITSYNFTNIGGELVQTDFMFNNVKKLLMTTENGITIKENRVE